MEKFIPTRFQRQVITTPPNAPNQVIVEGEKKGEKKKVYHFDYVFPPETTQEDVYERAVENLVEKFLEGTSRFILYLQTYYVLIFFLIRLQCNDISIWSGKDSHDGYS